MQIIHSFVFYFDYVYLIRLYDVTKPTVWPPPLQPICKYSIAHNFHIFQPMFDYTGIEIHGLQSSFCLNKLITRVAVPFNRNGVQIIKLLRIYGSKHIIFPISQNSSADLKGPKVKYKLHYGRCTGPLFRAATRHNTSCSDKKIKI